MRKKTLDLSMEEKSRGGVFVRRLILHNSHGPKREFFFEFSEEDAPGSLKELDAFVFGIVFLAMQEKADVRVRGAMSRTALYGLAEFQGAWHAWRPTRYRPSSIAPDCVVDATATAAPARAISAFSGGADSLFTVLGHTKGSSDPAALPLTDLLLVQGFDIGVEDMTSFERLRTRSHEFIAGTDLRLRCVRTNLARTSGQDWQDSFVAQLSCCLHQYGQEFSYAMLGSSEPYRYLFLPWGSNPVTDPLLSTDRTRLILDGCRFSRTEKIARIAESPAAVKGLNVCWEGASGENCGGCEKCMRTRMNFLAVGVDSPTCFPGPFRVEEIQRMQLTSPAAYVELVSLRDYAKAHGRSGTWVRALQRRLLLYRLWDRWLIRLRDASRRTGWMRHPRTWWARASRRTSWITVA